MPICVARYRAAVGTASTADIRVEPAFSTDRPDTRPTARRTAPDLAGPPRYPRKWGWLWAR